MKVLLLEDVEHVGKAGEVVEVSDEVARNTLFEKGLAAAATGDRERAAKTADERRGPAQGANPQGTPEEELSNLQRIVELVDRKTVHIQAPVSPQGEFEGAVTAEDIAAEIERALSTKLPAGAVHLQNPLFDFGETKLTLEFPHGLEAEVTVVVEAATSTTKRA